MNIGEDEEHVITDHKISELKLLYKWILAFTAVCLLLFIIRTCCIKKFKVGNIYMTGIQYLLLKLSEKCLKAQTPQENVPLDELILET